MAVPEETRLAVASFISLIADADQRQAFVANPAATFMANSIDTANFPDEVFEVVSNLSFGELSTLAHLNQRLVAAGFERPGEPPGISGIL